MKNKQLAWMLNVLQRIYSPTLEKSETKELFCLSINSRSENKSTKNRLRVCGGDKIEEIGLSFMLWCLQRVILGRSLAQGVT